MEHGSRSRTRTVRTVTVSPMDSHRSGINNVQGKSDFGHHRVAAVNCGAFRSVIMISSGISVTQSLRLRHEEERTKLIMARDLVLIHANC